MAVSCTTLPSCTSRVMVPVRNSASASYSFCSSSGGSADCLRGQCVCHGGTCVIHQTTVLKGSVPPRPADDHNRLAPELVQPGQANSCGCGGTAGDADQYPLLPGQPSGKIDRLIAGYRFNPVNQAQVKGFRYEAGADPLDFVGGRLQRLACQLLADDRTFGRFNRHREDLLALLLLDIAGDTADGAAGADPGYQQVNAAIGIDPDSGPVVSS